MSLIKNNLYSAEVGFKTLFNKVLQETEAYYEKIATTVKSNSRVEIYQWLGALPRMREWLGDRVIKNLETSEYTIKNKTFESTISIALEDIEDDKLNLYKIHFESLAQTTKKFPDELVFKMLEEGFNNKCYDGVNFFGTHKSGERTFTNKSNKVLDITSYVEARTTMMQIKDEQGRSLNIKPNMLIVPASLEAQAREILNSDFVNGSTNIYKNTAELLVVPELSSDTAWYLLDTTKVVKPLIFQLRKEPKLVALTNNTDQNVFMHRSYIYGVDMRCNAGYSFWQMAYGSTGIGK